MIASGNLLQFSKVLQGEMLFPQNIFTKPSCGLLPHSCGFKSTDQYSFREMGPVYCGYENCANIFTNNNKNALRDICCYFSTALSEVKLVAVN